MVFLLATPRAEELKDFISGLKQQDNELFLAGSGQEALDRINALKPALVIVDDRLPDFETMPLIKEILGIDVTICTAVITGMPPKLFHETSEGLGILCALPAIPNADDAARLLKDLDRVLKASETA